LLILKHFSACKEFEGVLKNFKTLKAGAGLVMEARQEAVQQHQA
jgi:hypothetical protein